MKYEVYNASEFLMKMIRNKNHGLTDQQLLELRTSIQRVLIMRYRDHWFPESPFKGSGYRCIRINGRLDPAIIQAASDTGISKNLLQTLFPRELTMWVDPKEVAYRIGESGSIFVYWRDTRHLKNLNKLTSVPGNLTTTYCNGTSYAVYNPSVVPGITRGDMACNYSQYKPASQFKSLAYNFSR